MMTNNQIKKQIKYIKQFNDPLIDEIYYELVSMGLYGESSHELDIYNPHLGKELVKKAYTTKIIEMLPCNIWEHILQSLNELIATEVLGVGVEELWL